MTQEVCALVIVVFLVKVALHNTNYEEEDYQGGFSGAR